MSAERHAMLTAAFLEVYKLDPPAREVALCRLGAKDAETANEVRDLLEHHEGPATPVTLPPMKRSGEVSPQPTDAAQDSAPPLRRRKPARAVPPVETEPVEAPAVTAASTTASEVEPTPAPTAEPEPTPTPMAKSEPTPMPTAKSEPTPAPTAKSESTPAPIAKSEPTPAPIARSEPTSETTAEIEPESARTAQSAPTAEFEPESNSVPTPVLLPAPAPAIVPATATVPAPVSGDRVAKEEPTIAAASGPAETPSATRARPMLHPGKRRIFWPLTAAAALIVAAAGWTVPLIKSPAEATATVAPARESTSVRPASELVRAFLVEAMGQPDPAATGRDASVAAWLDRTGRELESRFADRPEVKATIHATLGHAYTGLRLHKSAERHYRAMLELRRAALGNTDRATLEAMSFTGCALLEQGRRLEEAEQFLREAFSGRLAAFGAEDVDTLSSRMQLARLHAKRAEIEEAERTYEDTLEVMRRTLGPDHPVTLEGMERYALFLLGLNRTAEAAPRVEEVYRRYRKHHGPDHPRTVALLNALATTYSRRGDDAKAEEAFKKLLRIYVEHHGKEHQKTLFARLNLGIVLEKRKDYAAAEAQFRQAVEVHRRAGVLDPPVLVTAATRWGRVLAELGRLEQAATEFGRIDALVTRLYGVRDPRLHRFRAERGELLVGLGRYADAERVLLENYQWLKERPGDGMPRRDDYLAPLVRLYEKWGKDREAKRFRAEIARRSKARR